MTTQEARERLGVSRQRVHALIHEGRIKAKRSATRFAWDVDEASVEEYRQAQAKEGRPEAA